MATETFTFDHTAGASVYVRIYDDSGQVFDADDDTFKAIGSATTPYIAATERTGMNGTGYSGYTVAVDLSQINSTSTVKRYTMKAFANGTPATTDVAISAALSFTVQSSQLGETPAIKSDTAAILDDTGSSGVVVASGSKSGYALSSSGMDAVTLPADLVTAASIAADAITDAKVAADVTVASVTGAVGSVIGNVGGNVAGSVGSISGVSFPANFADLAVTASTGRVTVGTNADKTGYSLSSTQTFDLTGNVTGNLSGSVGSVTGSVGSVAAGGITASSIATGAVDADAIAADAVTEIQSGLATAAELAKVPKSDGTSTWNATALASIQGEATDALTAYDPPTNAEMEARTIAAATYATSAGLDALETHGDAAWATATGFSTHSAADVWAAGTRTLTAFAFTVNTNANATETAILEDTGTTLPATLAAIQGATFDTSTDSLESLRNRGDSAWTTATGFSTHSAAEVWTNGTRTLTAGTNIVLAKGTGVTGFTDIDAAGIRTAVGMASANFDTQIADLPTVAEFNARTLAAADYFDPATDTVASVTTVGSVTTKTGYKLASDGLDSVSTTAPSGVAANFREMVVQTWRRFFRRSTLTSTQLKTYADDGSTVVTTQTVSDDGTEQTQGAAT